MEQKVKNFMEENSMLQDRDNILVGISGGPDSVCLLKVLSEIVSADHKIYGVHVNHMLREESAQRDEAFVKSLCKEWKIPLKIYHKDVAAYARQYKKTLEEAGRIIRYECFQESLREWGCHKIALAHHKDDLAETVLFRMIRGTGLKGLAAIRPKSGNYIRPLLCVSKEDICTYLQKKNQSYMLDETNQEIIYSRNYIRNKIMPDFTHMNPKAADHIAALAKQAAELDDYMQDEIRISMGRCAEKTKEGYHLNLETFLPLHPYMQREILRQLIFLTAGKEKDISLVHVDVLQKLLRDFSGSSESKFLDLPYGVKVMRKRKSVEFFASGKWESKQEIKESIYYEVGGIVGQKEYTLSIKGQVFHFSLVSKEEVDYSNNDCVKYLDYDKITRGICVRNRREGDYLILDQSGHSKSLRRIFIDAKIPKEERENRLLLADGNHIIWIVDGRISEEYKVRDDTRRVLKITLE